MSRLERRLERDLGEVAARARPSPSAWGPIAARLRTDEEVVPLVPAPAAVRPARPRWPAIAAAAAVVIVASVAVAVAVAVSVGDDDPTSTADQGAVTTFVSPRNGFSVERPEAAAVAPATQLWGWGERVDDGFDVIEIRPAMVLKGTSRAFSGDVPCLDDEGREIPCGSTGERIDRALAQDLPGGCGVPRAQQAEITVDGQPGRLATCPGRVEATVLHGARLYLFVLEHDRSDARADFEAIAASIELTPETGVDFLAPTETFVSPTYGLSFGYIRGITPAEEPWAPGSEPVDPRVLGRRFDAVETGYGAYLEVASTEVPDGVSIDAWVDEYVTPVDAASCGVPRSEQADITVDGEPGRLAACTNRIEATVVAGGRLYLFTVYRTSRDARALFDVWADTVDLTPETAAVP